MEKSKRTGKPKPKKPKKLRIRRRLYVYGPALRALARGQWVSVAAFGTPGKPKAKWIEFVEVKRK